MKNKIISKPNDSLNFKIGKPIKEIIPNTFPNHRIMNSFYNTDNFIVKKQRDYKPPYEPYELFPEWPLEEEIEVFLN